MFTVTPTQEQVFTCLRSALLAIMPAGVEVVQAQDNRVIEPRPSDFIVMTPMRRDRLETNVDTPMDALFTASIAGGTMTITGMQFGQITLGNQIFGSGIAAGTLIVKQLSGSVGGTGLYTVSVNQTLSSRTLAAGTENLLNPTQFMVQLDVHGPNSGDNAQVISGIFRDEYGVNLFVAQCQALGIDDNAVVPFYADDPRSIPFWNAEEQMEKRWVIEAFMQINEQLLVPQQFAGTVTTTEVSVLTAYPA
jgi:hypothetical protein